MLQAYNDWAIDEWCCAIRPLDPWASSPCGTSTPRRPRSAASPRRAAGPSASLRRPRAGLPSFLSGYWDPMLAALSEENMVLSLHIGAGFAVIQRAEEAPVDHLMVLACQISAITAQDLLSGRPCAGSPTSRWPCPRAASAGSPSTSTASTGTSGTRMAPQRLRREAPSEVFRDHILACYITDPSGLLLRDRIGLDSIAWECDYPHTDTTWPESPEFAWKSSRTPGAATTRSTRSPGRTPAASTAGTPSSTPRRSRRPSARCGSRPRRRRDPHARVEWRKRNEAAGSAWSAPSSLAPPRKEPGAASPERIDREHVNESEGAPCS